MNTYCKVALINLLFIFICVISGCTVQRNSTPTKTAITLTPQKIPVIPSGMSTQILTLSPTKTFTKAPPKTQTPMPMSTGAPTKPPEEIIAWISKMLETNGGCNLPCWWGIVPGETTWNYVVALLEPFSSEIEISEEQKLFSSGAFFFTIPEGINSSGYIYLGFNGHDQIIDGVSVVGIEEINTYKISNLLDTYGVPSDVFVTAYSPLNGSSDQIQPINIRLFYRDSGIYAQYSTEGETKNGVTRGCFESGPYLTLWNPMNQSRYTELVNGDPQNEPPFLPIEDALSMSKETFYQIYKGDNQSVCIETPRNVWQDLETLPP